MASKPPFYDLVQNHSAEIFAYLWRLIRVTQDAEDCLQECYLRAWRAYPRLAEDANRRAWLYKIATNVANSFFRKGRIATEQLDGKIRASDKSPADRLIQNELLEAVSQVVTELPPKQRAALVMRKYQEMRYAEIALALNCSEQAARASVSLAVKKIRQRFPAAER